MAPLSDVSTGSGHEADDEAETEDRDEDSAVKKIRNAINELQKEPKETLPKRDEENKENDMGKRIVKAEPNEEASNEDTYSFSYSETFSADEEDDNKIEEPKIVESKTVYVDENKETISCRILTSDNNSIEFRPSKTLSETIRQECRAYGIENTDMSKENLKKDILTPRDPRTVFMAGSTGQITSISPGLENSTSDEAMQEWAKEVRNN